MEDKLEARLAKSCRAEKNAVMLLPRVRVSEKKWEFTRLKEVSRKENVVYTL